MCGKQSLNGISVLILSEDSSEGLLCGYSSICAALILKKIQPALDSELI